MKLFIIRHPETEWNRQDRLQGHLDSPLTAAGQIVAAAVGQWLKNQSIEAIYSSDLGRCRQTVGIIETQLAVPVFYNAALREQNFGWLNGQSDQFVAAHCDLQDFDATPRGGESAHDQQTRVLRYLFAVNGVEIALIVTHSGGVRGILAAYHSVHFRDPRCLIAQNEVISLQVEDGQFVPGSLQQTTFIGQ